jgi:pilus assembly protein CpaB
MRPRRRRGFLLLALALASGGLAASQVSERERNVDARIGPLVPVVVAARDIAPEAPLRRADMAVERVPARFIPADALGEPARLAGARAAVPVAAGAYITAGVLQGAASAGDRPLKPGERAVELGVAGGGALALAGPGSRVDVLVSTQAHDGAGRTVVALEDVALLDLHPAAGGDLAAVEEPAETPAATAASATALATLRVTARQAVYLTAAESFALEIRLLARPPGDRRRTGAVAVTEGDL